MPVEMAIGAWRSLRLLVGDKAKVHLTGGEPFLYWQRVVEIMQTANQAGLGPVDMIETNGYWATDPGLVRERLEVLDRLGLRVLKISCDPFHQAFVPIERPRLLFSIAQQLLGPDRVVVRWREYLDQPLRNDMAAYLRSIKEHPCRFTGRAAGPLADASARYTLDQLQGQGCLERFLSAKGVHLDPFGNLFSGTCSGIIIGNLNTKSLDRIWLEFDPTEGIVGLLAQKGPAGLLEIPQTAGYQPLRLYADRCHLCTHIRSYLHSKSALPQLIGPAECYQ